jgi:hypothetical protein
MRLHTNGILSLYPLTPIRTIRAAEREISSRVGDVGLGRNEPHWAILRVPVGPLTTPCDCMMIFFVVFPLAGQHEGAGGHNEYSTRGTLLLQLPLEVLLEIIELLYEDYCNQ